MHCSGQTDSQHQQSLTQQHTMMRINQHQSHSAHQNTCGHQHSMIYQSILRATKPAPYLPIDGVPSTHLDHPPDQFRPFCTLLNGPLCDLPSKIQFTDWYHNTPTLSNLTATTFSNQTTPWPYSDHAPCAPAMCQSNHHPTCCQHGTHDLKPPSLSPKHMTFVPQPHLKFVPEQYQFQSAQNSITPIVFICVSSVPSVSHYPPTP